MASVPRTAVKFFVGNLPWSVGHAELKHFFKGFGRVLGANVRFDTKTGSSKGFGFVVFDDDGQIVQKLENRNNLLLEGQHLNVRLEREE